MAAVDPTTQMNTYKSYVTMLGNPSAKDESKLKAAQEMSENFEVILDSTHYPAFLAHMMKIFPKIIQDGEPNFISEYNAHQIKKLILEMIHRLPNNEYLKPYVVDLLKIMLNLLETENEENALICLRIITDYHKKYKPSFNPRVPQFLQFVKSIYSGILKNVSKILAVKPPIRVNSLLDLDIESQLQETFSITTIHLKKKGPDGNEITYNLIPRAVFSLKLLQEIPSAVVLFFSLYSQNIRQDLVEIIPIVTKIITLAPSMENRAISDSNKEVFFDYIGAQIKGFMLLAYSVKCNLDVVQQSDSLGQGIIRLLNSCPMEATNFRREYLLAMKQLITTELRMMFLPYVGSMLDDKYFLGPGYTAHQVLRPLAITLVGDFVHHVKQKLPFSELSKAINFFSRNLHDESLTPGIQTFCSRVVLSLIENIKVTSGVENCTNQGRELLLKILQIHVLKLESIARLVNPILSNRGKLNVRSDSVKDSPENKEDVKLKSGSQHSPDNKNKTLVIGGKNIVINLSDSPVIQHLPDYKSCVKTIIFGVRTVIANNLSDSPAKLLSQKETLIFIRFVKWGLKALDTYILDRPDPSVTPPTERLVLLQDYKLREEKQLIESFSSIFTAINPHTFREIFSITIDDVVEQVFKNRAQQLLIDQFLLNQGMSPIFGAILLEYLLKRMDQLGANVERSDLYLNLFKLVFGSVSCYPGVNENMICQNLGKIVENALELAKSAKEPFNYFLLLRALFRSIGGGSHDLLYQKFLPLLPKLLEDLNRFQSGLHKQHMKENLIELCLTVPVRLSSLLPYLQKLMNPLVYALNGSPHLLSQALRTLELCVDNLEPTYIHSHIRPVSADLIQALWRIMRDPVDESSRSAFRILGKLGGENRKVMTEPQKLEYVTQTTNSPEIIVCFQEYSQPIGFSVKKVIEMAFSVLNSKSDSYHKKQSWQLINAYLAASVKLNDDSKTLFEFFNHPSFKNGEILPQQTPLYVNEDLVARDVQKTALSGLFLAAAEEELKASVLGIMVSYVRHYTMLAIAQQTGPLCPEGKRQIFNGQNPLVIVDALQFIMGHENKELAKFGHLALFLILETATTILGSKERASQLFLMEYISEKMSSLCYERACFSKLGGCTVLNFLSEKMPIKWILIHLLPFVKALLFVMMDLSDEIANGAIDMARTNLNRLLRVCADPGIKGKNPELGETQDKGLCEATREFMRQITSSHDKVQEEAVSLIRLLAEIQGKTLTEIMEPHKDILADLIPPMKHRLIHQPVNAQIGIMHGNTFCMSLHPRLFSINLSIPEHRSFCRDLVFIIEATEERLSREPCYKSVSDFTNLKKSALRAFSSYQYIKDYREKIFQFLYNALEKPNAVIQETAFECIKKLISDYQIETELVHATVKPMLANLGDYRNSNKHSLERLFYMNLLFPSIFNAGLYDKLVQHIRSHLQSLIEARKDPVKSREIGQMVVTIIEILNKMPTASPRFVDSLCKLVLQSEKLLIIEASSPFRLPLIKFLSRYPVEALTFLLQTPIIKDQQIGRFFEFMLKSEYGNIFRVELQKNPLRLMQILHLSQRAQNISVSEKNELRYQAINIISILVEFDDQWLAKQNQLVTVVKQIWCNDEYQTVHKNIENVDLTHLQEPELMVKILLNFFQQNSGDIDLLFQLLKALCGSFIPNFQFFKEFLETTVAQTYSVQWKRQVFFKFVEYFPKNTMSQELKACILNHVIIECFKASFEKGECQELMGGPPTLCGSNPEHVVSVFINTIIDTENPCRFEDILRIGMLRLACLLVEQASEYLRDPTNKSVLLRRLMAFAWPCLLSRNCVDHMNKCHGHLLLSHIIGKFSIQKNIVNQVFHSLLRAHAPESKQIVRQALEILTPVFPLRMDSGYKRLGQLTKKMISEEGHSMQSLCHGVQLVVTHHKVYYPVRHQVIHCLVSAIQRLGFSTTMEHKKLAMDVAETIIDWGLLRIKEEAEAAAGGNELKRSSSEDQGGMKRIPSSGSNSSFPATATKTDPDYTKRIEGNHANVVLNFLLKSACEVHDPTTVQGKIGEQLTNRCANLLKKALSPEMWLECSNFDVSWLEKILLNAQTPQPKYENIYKALELLICLTRLIHKEKILSIFNNLERGLGACVMSTNTKLVRFVYEVFARLMTIFPAESINSPLASKHKELDSLYRSVGKFIADGLTNYERVENASFESLSSSLMMLKAACKANQSYIDRLITIFMQAFHKMVTIHIHVKRNQTNQLCTDLLINSLSLVKNRVGVMGTETRKLFINSMLVNLIEKSPDSKVVKSVIIMLDEWMRNKDPILLNQHPCFREKSFLLYKMMMNVEKRFPDDVELNTQFLELVCFIYKDDVLKNSELTCKLEPAFLSGLRCTQPQIRIKFFEIFDASMKRRLFHRLLYIVCSQNWHTIGPHYWIKQCIELLMTTTDPTRIIKMTNEDILLPSIRGLINLAESEVKDKFIMDISVKEEKPQLVEMDLKEDLVDPDFPNLDSVASRTTLAEFIAKHGRFLEIRRNIQTGEFLTAASQICHLENSVAEGVWLDTFPKVWSVLNEHNQDQLAKEMVPFVCSGCHIIQKDCHPSAVATFIEAFAKCDPPIPMRPAVIKYLAKSHNIWHHLTLDLEQMIVGNTSKVKKEFDFYDSEGDSVPNNEILDSLSSLYSLLCEDDMWSGLWQKHAHYKETLHANALEQQGFFEQAQNVYTQAMSKFKQEYLTSSAPIEIQKEVIRWEERWIHCARELNQWDLLLEFGGISVIKNPLLILESSWRISNWSLMEKALELVENNIPKEMDWKIHLYRGFLSIYRTGNQNLKVIDIHADHATNACIREWRRLPHVVSYIHVPLLQAAQRIIDLQEAKVIHQSLATGKSNAFYPLTNIVKTWRNRLPSIADDLSHWSDIFSWREQQYQSVISFFRTLTDNAAINFLKQYVHLWAQSTNIFAKIARKQNLNFVCLEVLAKIHSVEKVPIFDCYTKIKQLVKCYIQTASFGNPKDLMIALECLNSTDFNFFKKEMISDLFALRGRLLTLLGSSEEANQAYSTSVQLYDDSTRAWALWGDYMEKIFTGDPTRIDFGASTVICFLNACRHNNQSKSRKHVSRILWLLNYQDSQMDNSLLKQVGEHFFELHPLHWLPWIPQLLMWLVRLPGDEIVNLLIIIGRMFPQAVYFPIRTLYMTLKVAHLEVYNAEVAAGRVHRVDNQTENAHPKEGDPIKASAPMLRCSMILKRLKEIHPTILSSLEGIVDQVGKLRETWHGEVLRHLRQVLTKSYTVAFENRENISQVQITSQISSFINKLVSTFGLGMDNISLRNQNTGNCSAASEALARRIKITCQDPVFRKMRKEFAQDFNSNDEKARLLFNVIKKLKKWIKILEEKAGNSPKSFLLEDRCRFLSNFSLETANIKLPGEFLLPKTFIYQVKIAKFLPRVEIVQRHNSTAHRLRILGDNGRLYPYLLVMNDSSGDARRDERILQLLRLLNINLRKQKETSRRLLQFTVPKIVPLDPHMRLVEDNPSSITLMDVFKQSCDKISILHDAPISEYYDVLANVQARGARPNHQELRKIFYEMQTRMVPKTILKDWALTTFPGPTDYWTFRKMFTAQLALANLAEYVFHLTKLNPDMMYMHRDSGLLNVAYFKFDIDDASGTLNASRPVPFRLTPNIHEFINNIGISGPLTASMIATARCLSQPSYQIQFILRAIIRDEIVGDEDKKSKIFFNGDDVPEAKFKTNDESLIKVNRAVTEITTRLKSVAHFDGNDSKVKTLLIASNSADNLCRMDPSWHPWL